MTVQPSNQTTWHAIASIAAFVIVGVGGHLFGLGDALTTGIATGVSLLLVSLGLMQAGDAAALQKTASDLTTAIDQTIASVQANTNQTIAGVQADLLAKHTENATQIAVNTAVAGAPIFPKPYASPTVPIPVIAPIRATDTADSLINSKAPVSASPVPEGPHLVT